MKIDMIKIIAVLILLRGTGAYAQHVHDEVQKTTSDNGKMEQMMGSPTAEQRVDGLKVQLWVLSQEDHVKMMNASMKDSVRTKGMHHEMNCMMGMKHDSQEHSKSMKDQADKEKIPSGTHHIMIVILDSVTSQEVTNATATLHIMTPSQKHTNPELIKIKNHFGAGVTIDEKGPYALHFQITIDGKEYQSDFTYELK